MIKSKKDVYEFLKNDETGNILTLAVILLLFLIFILSITSLSVSNRVRVARKSTDNNQVSSQVMQSSENVENSIQQILLECDELARYYVSRQYYEKDDVIFTNGSNPDLDTYLSELITTDFQRQVKLKMDGTSLSLKDGTKTIFAYLVIKRTATSTNPQLKSITSAIDANRNSLLSISENKTKVLQGINENVPSFQEILVAVQGDKAILEVSCILSYNTANTLSLTNSIDTRLVYSVNAFSYVVNGNVVLKPDDSFKDDVLRPETYQLTNIMN